MHHAPRRTSGKLVGAVLGAALLAGPASAAAQAPAGPLTFGERSDAVTLCGFVGDTGPTSVLSTATRVALQFPDTTRTIAAGREFRLGVQIQKGQSDCDDTEVVPSLRLPTGVQIANVADAVTCRTFSSADPQGTAQSAAGCPLQPSVEAGFLRLAPAGSTWSLRNARDVVEVFVRVVATSTGAKTASARVCDVRSHESFFENGGACAGSPAANVTASLGFTVGTDNDGGDGGNTTPPAPQGPAVTWRDSASRELRMYWGDTVKFKTTIDFAGPPAAGEGWMVVGGLRRQIQRRKNGRWREVYDRTVEAHTDVGETRVVKKLTVALLKGKRYRFRSCIGGSCSAWTPYRA